MSGQLSSTLTECMQSVNVEECTEDFCDDTEEAESSSAQEPETESVATRKPNSRKRARHFSSEHSDIEAENTSDSDLTKHCQERSEKLALDSEKDSSVTDDNVKSPRKDRKSSARSSKNRAGHRRGGNTVIEEREIVGREMNGGDDNHADTGIKARDSVDNAGDNRCMPRDAVDSPGRGMKRKCASLDEVKLRQSHQEGEERRAAREAAVLKSTRQQPKERGAEGGGGEGSKKLGSGRTKFVKDWEFVQTLGEGAYGEVKLACCERTNKAVAVKIINLKGAKQGAWDDVRKEICIHRLLNHKNIIRFWGMRQEGDIQYLFLEYASGGELFDRIEPDVGIPQADAQRYYKQLIDGLEYLHSKGVAHRDIKPENLLLDEMDNLKIADFGLATVFRHHGKSRHLNRLCGSAPYMAPEVIGSKPYQAEPADLWSSGVVLVTMLGGELPWDAAVTSCQDYLNWRECHIEKRPWNKIDNLALCLLRKLLVERPEKRYTIEQIRQNQWFKKDFSSDLGHQLSAGPKRRRLRGSESEHSPGAISSSQPAMTSGSGNRGSSKDCPRGFGCSSDDHVFDTSAADGPISFSQPTHSDDLLLSSQLNGTQQMSGTQSSQTPMQKLVRRMTRFFCQKSRPEVMEELSRVLDTLDYTWKQTTSYEITMHTVDRRKTQLTMKIMILEMGDNLLLDFRLSKGDGLEFKRHFMRIRELMKAIICKVPPSWPNV